LNSALKKILDRLQWDETLGYALLTRLWQAISGPITIVFLIESLDLSEQGIYYSIIGIVGIQAYFELGLLNVLVSQSGHATAAISLVNQKSNPSENDKAWIHAATRMRDLIRASTRWFSVAAILYAIIAIIFGWLTLSDSRTSWQLPLLAAIPAAAVAVAFAPSIAILEGAGFRDLIYRYRLGQMVLGSLAVWAALFSGLKLWSLVLASMTQAMVAAYIVLYSKRSFFTQYLNIDSQDSTFAWMREVVPVQWRVALITASFHFATQFFTIIVCTFHSDSEAAPLGMTLSISSAIQMVALAWVQTKYPLVAIHHGKGDRETAGTLWRQTAVISTILLVTGFAALVAIVLFLPNVKPGLETRFLEPLQVILLAIGALANHIAAIQGFYVLAMKAKPLLAASLFGSIPTAIAVWCGGYYFSTSGVLFGYAMGMGLFLAPAHTWAYIQFRRKPSPT
jgi:hypothetical protein